MGAAFLLFNTVGLALFFLAGAWGGAILATGPALVGVGLAAAVFWRFGGGNVMRTWANKSTADFTRQGDSGAGGWVYDVRPARASRLPIIVLAPPCAILALLWSGTVALLLGAAVASIFLLPGARHRKPARISVSPQGLSGGDVSLAIQQVSEIAVGNNGVGISREPLAAGPTGVSTSSMVGRGLARRQVARSYTVTARGEGQSRASVLAGGLTEECANNLARDLFTLVQQIRNADANPGPCHSNTRTFS